MKPLPTTTTTTFSPTLLITCTFSLISLLWTSQPKGSLFPAREPHAFPPPAWVEALCTIWLCCSAVPPLSSPFFPSCRQSVPSRCSREGARPKTAKPSPAPSAVRTEGGELPRVLMRANSFPSHGLRFPVLPAGEARLIGGYLQDEFGPRLECARLQLRGCCLRRFELVTFHCSS